MHYAVKSCCAAVLGAFLVTGCNNNDSNSSNSVSDESNLSYSDLGNAAYTNRIVGNLVDSSTLTAVTNATITLWIDNQQAVSYTLAEGETFSGDFAFENIPNGTHRLEINAEGYASVNTTVVVKTEFGEEGQTLLKNIGLSPAAELKLLVTDEEGTPVTGGTVLVYSSGVTNSCSSRPVATYSLADPIRGQITTGSATISGLNPCLKYYLVIPAFDENGDGVFDYESSTHYYPNYPDYQSIDISLSSGPYQVVLTPYNTTAPIKIVHVQGGEIKDPYSYFYEDYKNSFGVFDISFNRFIDPDGTLKIFFSVPFEEIEIVNINYGLKYDSSYLDSSVQNVDAQLSFNSDKTILTITPPPEGYSANQIVTITGNVKALGSNEGAEPFELNIDAMINPVDTLDADIILGAYSSATIVLNQYVDIDSLILKRTSDGDTANTTSFYGSFIDANLAPCTNCGNHILYRGGISTYNISPSLTAGETVTVILTGTDIHGKEVSLTKTLAVRDTLEGSSLLN